MTRSTVAAGLAAGAATLATLAASAGLLVPGLYRDAPSWAAQARGADLATLTLALPLAIGALLLGRRRSDLARPVAGGVLLYLAYTYILFAFSVAFNPLTVVYIAITGCVLWALILGAPDALLAPIAGVALPRRATGSFLVGVAVLFALLWLGQIASAVTTGLPPEDLVEAGVPANPVHALDLAFFLPLTVVAGVLVLRRHRASTNLAVPVLMWAALISAQIIGGFLFTALSGAPVPVPVALVIGLLALGAAALVVRAVATPGARGRFGHAAGLTP